MPASLSLNKWHNKPSPASTENSNVQKRAGKRLCDGKESDWITLKMGRLRKKEEETEEVTMLFESVLWTMLFRVYMFDLSSLY